MRRQRLEQVGIALLVLACTVLPVAVHGWTGSAHDRLFLLLYVGAGLGLVWWRTRPRLVAAAGLTAALASAAFADGTTFFPDIAVLVISGLFVTLALGWSGRAAWVVGAVGFAWVVAFQELTRMGGVPALLVSVPAYAAGTVFRQRQELAEELAARGRELEEEREVYAAIALRHERARIASELHDIVGHAISVMVVQAAAGQRLVDRDPDGAKKALNAIAESAREGKADLERLVELLGGTSPADADLTLIDEVVARAANSGFDVSCRFEGSPAVDDATASLAFRVVQESLTNALRHAPGAPVRVLVSGAGGALTVRVENEAATADSPAIGGTGRGLVGLRERVADLGGQLLAGPTPAGGWLVEASLPG